MRTRLAVVIAGVAGCLATLAHADPKAEIAATARAAMASYDAMDYEAARKRLYQALAAAKQARLDNDPVVARVYLDLAITQLAASEQEAAKLSLLSAAQIDPKITIEAAYRSPELVTLLDEAKAAAVAIEAAIEVPPPAPRGATVPATAPADAEDPIEAPAQRRPSRDIAASSAGHRPARIVIAVAGGTGVGYVTGKTEGNNDVRSCCIGTSLVVIHPELGYRVTPRIMIGAAARLGLPIGANLPGHATLAPAGFLRLRYGLSDAAGAGDGLRVMAELGGGLLRNTLELDDGAGGGPVTDIVAQGPLLIGAGLGYSRHLAANLAFLVDVTAIAGIAVIDELGSAAHLNTGVTADLSLGLAIGF